MESKIFPNLPIPVIRDKNGKLTKDYKTMDWIAKLNEEVDEVKFALADKKKNLAEELCDVITVCTSYLEQLGYDQQKRGEFFTDINRKNFARGYISGSSIFRTPVKAALFEETKVLTNGDLLLKIRKEDKESEYKQKSKLEPVQVIRGVIAALEAISDDRISEGQKSDIEEAVDHLKAAHDNNYDNEDEVDDCIAQLESLIDNSESFFQ